MEFNEAILGGGIIAHLFAHYFILLRLSPQIEWQRWSQFMRQYPEGAGAILLWGRVPIYIIISMLIFGNRLHTLLNYTIFFGIFLGIGLFEIKTHSTMKFVEIRHRIITYYTNHESVKDLGQYRLYMTTSVFGATISLNYLFHNPTLSNSFFGILMLIALLFFIGVIIFIFFSVTFSLE